MTETLLGRSDGAGALVHVHWTPAQGAPEPDFGADAGALALAKFTGKAGQLVILPGETGAPRSAHFGLGEAAMPRAAVFRGLSASLPAADYRLAGDLDRLILGGGGPGLGAGRLSLRPLSDKARRCAAPTDQRFRPGPARAGPRPRPRAGSGARYDQHAGERPRAVADRDHRPRNRRGSPGRGSPSRRPTPCSSTAIRRSMPSAGRPAPIARRG